MSHFVVLVIGTGLEHLEQAMAPFDEQTKDKSLLQFKSTEAEIVKEYAEDSIDIVRFPDGSFKYPWDREFKEVGESRIYPENTRIESIPLSALFPTLEAFMEAWHGTTERDPEKGEFGYWSNPNSKFDWYAIGGRWAGYFKQKEGVPRQLRNPPIFDNEPEVAPDHVDVITVKDWDLETQRERDANQARTRYVKFFSLLGEFSLPPSWDSVRNQFNEDQIALARAEYQANPSVAHLKKMDTEAEFTGFWCDAGDEFNCSLETYMQNARNHTGIPFAILKDGVWYERGAMGWFGCVHDEKDKSAWALEVATLFNNLAPDTTLIAVDCHI